MSDELKRCPFCGGVAVVYFDDPSIQNEFKVGCDDADCPVSPETKWFGSRKSAVEKWNTRIALTSVAR